MAKKKSNGNIIKRISDSVIWRNIILAVCAIIALCVLASVMMKVLTRHNKYKEVPEFIGMNIEQARDVSRKASMRLEINDSLYVPAYPGGVVLEQMPSAGTEVKSGRRIFVTLNSYSQKMVDIPYVTGYSLRQAKNNLELAGLEIAKITYQPDIATNNVIEQRYKNRVITSSSRIQAEQGSGITLIVGWNSDDRNPVVPKIIGFPLKEAKSRLWEAGFNIGKISFDDDISLLEEKSAKVYRQTPDQGTRVSPGSTISLMLTLDTEKVSKGSQESDKSAQALAKQREAEAAQAREEQTEQTETNGND